MAVDVCVGLWLEPGDAVLEGDTTCDGDCNGGRGGGLPHHLHETHVCNHAPETPKAPAMPMLLPSEKRWALLMRLLQCCARESERHFYLVSR